MLLNNFKNNSTTNEMNISQTITNILYKYLTNKMTQINVTVNQLQF